MVTNMDRPTLQCLAPDSAALAQLRGHFHLVDEPAPLILAQGDEATTALATALAHQPSPRAIVLIAPSPLTALDPAIQARLRKLDTPVLLLFGTEDTTSPPSLGSAWRRALPKPFVMFVYGATSAMADERPDSVADIIEDFLQRTDNFIVRTVPGERRE